MVKTYDTGVYYYKGKVYQDTEPSMKELRELTNIPEKSELIKNTIAYGILEKHNTSSNMTDLKIRFDALASHDITYVGIVQTARASGLKEFPIPYVLTNCHNSLCAVGGTINEDDHMFGLSAAKKFGGIYVPAHIAVIHQYMREMMSGCGKMILGSDSHTRYGALGTMAIGEGGGELAKQLLSRTYDVKMPGVVGVYLSGKPRIGVGPMDIALSIIKAVFEKGYVKNKVMEFIGDGIKNLGVEYRNGIDVMTTETTCLSSIWTTDEAVKKYYAAHGRKSDYYEMKEPEFAYYDGFVFVDMDKIEPMIAMPFHPSNVYAISELKENLDDILAEVERKGNTGNSGVKFTLRDKIKNGSLIVEQGVIAGCAGGTFDNICDAADILANASIGSDEFALSVYPSSQPTYLSLMENGSLSKLIAAGATVRTAFCGPCFGAGDVPCHNGLSVRHTTRNFPNREGSKPGNGQIASVALMDARSVAATALNKGRLTSATELNTHYSKPEYTFSKEIYENRVYFGYRKASTSEELKFGPNIVDWPKMQPLTDNLLLNVASLIKDPVTTTDELIPSGETSSYRSNPLALAEFTLSRKDPEYVSRAKDIQKHELERLSGGSPLKEVYEIINKELDVNPANTGIGSVVYAVKPGDGSAREQAASCQKVLGGWANIAREYATKRYRSNLINWGMVPFILEDEPAFDVSDYIFIPGIRDLIKNKVSEIPAYIVKEKLIPIKLQISDLTDDERDIILSGCLINYYSS